MRGQGRHDCGLSTKPLIVLHERRISTFLGDLVGFLQRTNLVPVPNSFWKPSLLPDADFSLASLEENELLCNIPTAAQRERNRQHRVCFALLPFASSLALKKEPKMSRVWRGSHINNKKREDGDWTSTLGSPGLGARQPDTCWWTGQKRWESRAAS